MLLNYSEINGQMIKKHLIELIYEKRTPGKLIDGETIWEIPRNHNINYMRFDQEFLYKYYRLLVESEWVGLVHFCPYKYAPLEIRKDLKEEQLKKYNENKSSVLRHVLYRDLSRANVLITLSAWLTVDDFRWHNIDSSVPEDLFYGLVLSYPDFVLPYASYCSGLAKDKIKNNLLNEEIKGKLDDRAKKNAEKHCT